SRTTPGGTAMAAPRRSFLRRTAGAGLALTGAGLALTAWPWATDQPLPAAGPNEQIRIGCIGVGNQGRGNLGIHLNNTVAVCDVDRQRLGEARERVQQGTPKPGLAAPDY